MATHKVSITFEDDGEISVVDKGEVVDDTNIEEYRNKDVVYTPDGKSEYKETVTIYEYKHIAESAKMLYDAGFTLADFVDYSEQADCVVTLVDTIKHAIRDKKLKEAAKRLFGDDDD